ncbi:DUF732 domain-containing protein [Gordonia amarae]|uniref:DUF732 domain-containing protein n=2 Tax=Gordonia amarae TaxID=36821 RepID=G7GR29_9ACTN|nr:DUF732 domain-containing protein [Gordonia amarae]MCS3877526.1 hypothetical protein [Gordonia amarae]QHN16256.1 DUF732 domain-containing protein [Gordonia amarae]QHN20825.1 DUF732 domain-containing protein [Gordonia amarae]QHN29676.1 DUF732 domain-containing protein [Gordonia amarae]QHN38452.1 DUF732 domain-containing protein [Gordonia amarae]
MRTHLTRKAVRAAVLPLAAATLFVVSACDGDTAEDAAASASSVASASESSAGNQVKDSTFFSMLDIAGVKVTDKPRFVTAAVKLCEAMVAGTSFTDARSALDVGLDEDGNAKVASAGIAAYCPDQQVKMATG